MGFSCTARVNVWFCLAGNRKKSNYTYLFPRSDRLPPSCTTGLPKQLLCHRLSEIINRYNAGPQTNSFCDKMHRAERHANVIAFFGYQKVAPSLPAGEIVTKAFKPLYWCNLTFLIKIYHKILRCVEHLCIFLGSNYGGNIWMTCTFGFEGLPWEQ